MIKLIAISDKESLLIQSSLSHWSFHINSNLKDNPDIKQCEILLDELDLCDSVRRKLSKAFTDLSIID